ncbi:MAG: spore germination protein [Firmicutes bacterium]|nr:spore germination protein [Bacillota bacterium]
MNPTPVSPSLATNQTWLLERLGNCADVRVRRLRLTAPVLLLYCDGLIDSARIDDTVLPALERALRADSGAQRPSVHHLHSMDLLDLELCGTSSIHDLNAALHSALTGSLVILCEHWDSVVAIDVQKIPSRAPEDSNSETSLRGARDCFTESLVTNVALLRKRLPTPDLQVEMLTVGSESHTRVAITYVSSVVDMHHVETARKRIRSMRVKGLTGSTELELALGGRRFSAFPLVAYSTRPDFVAASLLRGRVAVVRDGAPSALLAPANLYFLLRSAEDDYSSTPYVLWENVLRVLALLLSLMLPGLYVAIVSFHPEQLPIMLLSTIVTATKGVPVPLPVSTFATLLLFDLFREAGYRLPSVIGPTIGTVGGLIIGDAAMKAGITSSATVVVLAITAIATYALTNQVLAGIVVVLRLVVLLVASFFGFYGFLLALFAILTYVAQLRSFGVPYLAPFAPLSFRDLLHAWLPPARNQQQPALTRAHDLDRSQ